MLLDVEEFRRNVESFWHNTDRWTDTLQQHSQRHAQQHAVKKQAYAAALSVCRLFKC